MRIIVSTNEMPVDPYKSVDEFMQWYEETFPLKPSIAKNCVLRATIVSVWPPYGLALPVESRFTDVSGLILFHRSRIIENLEPANSPSPRVKIRFKNVSKYRIHYCQRSWPKAFQTGNQIFIRISIPLNECSNRWRKQDEQHQSLDRAVKLSNVIRYKAVKLWPTKDENTNDIRKDEPVLRNRSSRFDQMKQLYLQLTLNSNFCLEQLFGFTTRKLTSEILTHYCHVHLSSILLKSECNCNQELKSANIEKMKISERKSGNIEKSEEHSSYLDNSEYDVNAVEWLHYKAYDQDSPIWIGLEPIEDSNENEMINKLSGILNLDAFDSDKLQNITSSVLGNK